MKHWTYLFGLTLILALAIACGESAPTVVDDPVESSRPVPTAPSVNFAIKVEGQGAGHVVPGEEHDAYNSVPATSGWHYGAPLAPARWGIHQIPVPDEVLVHNLEHGYVNVHYNCPTRCEELVTELSEIVDDANEIGGKVLMSPYPDMDSKIALTAWTFIDKFDVFDPDRVAEFINSHESSPVAPEANVRR
jgi:hypothetical protein